MRGIDQPLQLRQRQIGLEHQQFVAGEARQFVAAQLAAPRHRVRQHIPHQERLVRAEHRRHRRCFVGEQRHFGRQTRRQLQAAHDATDRTIDLSVEFGGRRHRVQQRGQRRFLVADEPGLGQVEFAVRPLQSIGQSDPQAGGEPAQGRLQTRSHRSSEEGMGAAQKADAAACCRR